MTPFWQLLLCAVLAVLLGCFFLYVTAAFVDHRDSFGATIVGFTTVAFLGGGTLTFVGWLLWGTIRLIHWIAG